MRLLSWCILATGMIYGAAILGILWRDRDALRSERGSFAVLAPAEVAVFILCSFGLPDYMLHTIEGKVLGILDDESIPHTVVASAIVPGAVLAFAMLQTANPVDLVTLLATGFFVTAGSVTGARLLRSMDGAKVRRFLLIALALSLGVLVIRIIVSRGASGDLTSLSGIKLAVVCILCYGTGLVNVFGVPMKPTWTAIFLLAGMSPLATLSMVLVVGCFSPMGGGIGVLRQKKYNRKMLLASVIFGSIGALIGIGFAVAIPAVLLNILLVSTILIAIIVLK